jgi:hypothetical protein
MLQEKQNLRKHLDRVQHLSAEQIYELAPLVSKGIKCSDMQLRQLG